MSPRLALTSTLLASILSLAACGGGAEAPESTADPSPSGTNTSPATSATVFADCSAIPAAEMAPALGTGTATATVPPGGGSCTYALADPKLPSVSLEQFTVSDFADGWDGARANIATTALGPIDGVPAAVTGIGDGAEVVAGPSKETANPDGIGLVKIGDTIVRASVLDASGLTPDQVAEVTAKVLRVIAAHA